MGVDVEYGGVRVQGMCPHEFFFKKSSQGVWVWMWSMGVSGCKGCVHMNMYMYFFLKNQAKGCGCGCGVWGCQGARDVST